MAHTHKMYCTGSIEYSHVEYSIQPFT